MASPSAYTSSGVPPPGGGNKVRDAPTTYTLHPPPPPGGGDIEKRQDPSPYPTGGVPPPGGGNKIRDAPTSYTLRPPPPPGGGDIYERDGPTPYPTGGVPPPGGGNKIRDAPTSYTLRPPPPPGGGDIEERQEPSPYPTGGVPPPGGGNKVRRDTPTPYPTGGVPPPGGGNKIKRDDPTPYPTASGVPPPGSGDIEARQEPSPYPTGGVPPPGGGNKFKRASETSSVVSATTTAPTTTSASRFPYLQLDGGTGTASTYHFPQATIAAGDYSMFCPSGNCFQDCQNMTRVFQALPDGINENESTYGKHVPHGQLPDQTLFGVCSNLEIVSNLAQTSYPNTTFASFFPSQDAQTELHTVSTDLSMCLYDTCQYTRDPTQCLGYCSLDMLQSSNTSLSIVEGVYPCLYKLCQNTCGLPYANQDVYGVGVLASYITQAILVLLLAVTILFFASWRAIKQYKPNGDREFTIPRRMRDSMELFLATECYFGISAAIASYLMHPATVDPLNGYALLSVSITGFIPTVFTLMLLHSHGVKSWYTTVLTFTSWLFSTVLFFMLIRNLLKTMNNQRAIDRGLDALFKVDACGRSSAMDLCKQTFDTDPLSYLTWFYNYWSIPSVQTVPVLWALSTVVLLGIVSKQVYDKMGKHTQSPPIHLEAAGHGGERKNLKATISLGSLWLGCILFGLALGYQACMVISYTKMDVINWHDWSFGQVVALLFWAPPIINCIWSYTIETPPGNNRDRHAVAQHSKSRYSDHPTSEKEVVTNNPGPSPDSLSFRSISDQSLFSPPSDAPLFTRQGSNFSEHLVSTPTDAISGWKFGRGGRSYSKNDASIRNVIS